MDAKERFSDRVANYIRYRPGYPVGVVEALRQRGALFPGCVVADVGSGTGLLARLFLEAGHEVIGVEPNAPMRAGGEAELAGFSAFRSVAGSAEATGLADASVDLVVAGQAFHWFERDRARREFARILRGPRWVALVWNERLVETTPLLRAYENLLKQYATDYAQVDHRQMTPEVIGALFEPVGFETAEFANHQEFDFEGLRGRLLSSSYAPGPDHPAHRPMLEALRQVFDTYAAGGRVRFEYATRMYVGRLETQP